MFFRSKQLEESHFWRAEIDLYERWFMGSNHLHGEPPPNLDHSNLASMGRTRLRVEAVKAWFESHQKRKYLLDLGLDSDAFNGCRLLDIGCGPFLSALSFEGCDVFGLDPLIAEYIQSGFPLHIYEPRGCFISGNSEDIPLESGAVDAVISVNAIDHVDDFERTAKEIKRVLIPGGKIRMHVHYHKPYKAEPIEITDKRFCDAFSWAGSLIKINESNEKTGHKLTNKDEKFVVWSNF